MSPRPNLESQADSMSYEDWLRVMASDLEKRAAGIEGIPAISVMISPRTAVWIATVLRNHAQDMEENRG
jgi:hypothetical protein